MRVVVLYPPATFYAVTGRSRGGRRVGGKRSRGRAGICHVSIPHKPLHVKRLRRARVRDSWVCVPPRWIIASLNNKEQDLMIKEGDRGLDVVFRYYCVGRIVGSLNKLLLKCCFTSTETVRLIRDGSPGRPPRFHTASVTSDLALSVSLQCCFTSRETVGTVRDGEPSTSTQLLSSVRSTTRYKIW